MSELQPRVRPRRHRKGPNSAATLARAAAIVVAVVLLGELGTRAIADEFPAEATGAGEVSLKREALDAMPEPPAVVFLGDSTMDAGVDPNGFLAASSTFDTAYNASLLGARLPTQQSWAASAVLPARPSMVVQGVNPALLMTYNADPATVGTLDAVLESRITLGGKGVWPSINRWLTDESTLYRYRPLLQNPEAVWKATRDTFTGGPDEPRPFEDLVERQQQEGFWESVITSSGQFLGYADRQVTPTGSAPGLIQLVDSGRLATPLENLLALYRAHDVAPVVVILPAPLEVMAANGVDVDRWLDAVALVRSTAEDAGLVVLDYTDAGYPTDQFADNQHLNAAGSARFSRELAAQIDALCAAGTLTCT